MWSRYRKRVLPKPVRITAKSGFVQENVTENSNAKRSRVHVLTAAFNLKEALLTQDARNTFIVQESADPNLIHSLSRAIFAENLSKEQNASPANILIVPVTAKLLQNEKMTEGLEELRKTIFGKERSLSEGDISAIYAAVQSILKRIILNHIRNTLSYDTKSLMDSVYATNVITTEYIMGLLISNMVSTLKQEIKAQYDGLGSALKPAFESIVVARKPLSESTLAKNVLKSGTGLLILMLVVLVLKSDSIRRPQKDQLWQWDHLRIVMVRVYG